MKSSLFIGSMLWFDLILMKCFSDRFYRWPIYVTELRYQTGILGWAGTHPRIPRTDSLVAGLGDSNFSLNSILSLACHFYHERDLQIVLRPKTGDTPHFFFTPTLHEPISFCHWVWLLMQFRARLKTSLAGYSGRWIIKKHTVQLQR